MGILPRISENYRYDSTLDRINSARNDADSTNEMAVSGRKLRSISDDPVSTIKVFRNRAHLSHIDQFKKSIDFGKGFLAKTEDALTSISSALDRARELAIQQSNSTWDDAQRKAVASEIKQIASHVAVLGNSRYNDKYIFGGFQTMQPPISPEGNFLGDDGQIFIQIDEDSFRPINISGRDIFDVPPEEEGKRPPLLKVLYNLHESLYKNDREGLHEAMDNINDVMNRVIQSSASLGAKRNALDDALERIEKNEVQLTGDNNNLEAIDMVKSAIDLRRAESALQFTLQASNKMLTPSLVDFLK